MSSPDAGPFKTEMELLSKVLEKHHAAEYRLPELINTEKSWLERLLERLQEWLNGLFRNNAPHSDFSLIWLLFKYLLISAAVATLVLLLYLLVRALLPKVKDPLTRRPPVKRPRTEDLLSQQIRQAVEAGDLRLASRLRWKLFLYRKRIPSHTTPGEYRHGGDWLITLDELMFSGLNKALQDYKALDQTLARIEAEAGAHA